MYDVHMSVGVRDCKIDALAGHASNILSLIMITKQINGYSTQIIIQNPIAFTNTNLQIGATN